MKEQPEIAPEIRGLLEEIVADPRSSMRLTPKRALSSWFDSGETIRPREIAGTKAERHLVEAHREAMAQLLSDAAQIAYWKSPGFASRPIGANGQPYDPAANESTWREKVVSRASRAGAQATLLARLVGGINASDAHELAVAALGMAPSDGRRWYVALTISSLQPRAAIRLFSRLARVAEPATLRPRVLNCLAARLCTMSSFPRAVEVYRTSADLAQKASSNPPFGIAYAFNLSCLIGSVAEATSAAKALAACVGQDEPWLVEATRVIAAWTKSRSSNELASIKRVAERVASRVGGPCETICGAYEG